MASKIKVDTLETASGTGSITFNNPIAGFTSTGIDDNATSTAVTIDASENVGIGTVSPTSPLHITGSGHTALTITGGASSDAQIRFGDSANTTIGMINYDNAINALKFVVNGSTAAIIDNGGRAIIGGGVTLGNGSTYAAANTLDDYEEGTWTPTVVGGMASFTTQSAYYTKIGNLVTVNFFIDALVTKSGSTLSIGGLPFSLFSGSNYSTGAAETGGGESMIARANNNTTNMNFYKTNSTNTIAIGTDLGARLIATVTYRSA